MLEITWKDRVNRLRNFWHPFPSGCWQQPMVFFFTACDTFSKLRLLSGFVISNSPNIDFRLDRSGNVGILFLPKPRVRFERLITSWPGKRAGHLRTAASCRNPFFPNNFLVPILYIWVDHRVMWLKKIVPSGGEVELRVTRSQTSAPILPRLLYSKIWSQVPKELLPVQCILGQTGIL